MKHICRAALLCLLGGMIGLLGLVTCGGPEFCVHDWGAWQETAAAGCEEAGVRERVCGRCGKVEAEPTEAIGHTGGQAVCGNAACCQLCGREYGEPGNHTGEPVWVKGPYTHEQVYSCCAAQVTAVQAHTMAEGHCGLCGFAPTVALTTCQAASGETGVTVTVVLRDDPGITGLMMTVGYDSAALTLTEVQRGDALAGLVFTAPGELGSGATLLWDGVEVAEEDIRDGVLLTLVFDVTPGAAPGVYPISVDMIAYDNDLAPLALELTGGTVTVE